MTDWLLAPAPLASIADQLRSGALSILAYVEQVERRTRLVEPHIRALLPEDGRWERLRREARALEEQFPHPSQRPPLYGVLVGVKDLFSVDGMPTRAGSALPAGLFTGLEASTVTTLRARGALILGKTALDEFGYSEPSPTRNPHNLAHTAGGSSSGSAAAVAAGLCPLALGTQTSRSVIGPAAFCGIVGYKPTYQRIPTDGVVNLAPAFDCVGLLAQDVAGALLAATALVPGWRAAESRSWPSAPATEAGASRLPVLAVPEGTLLTWTLPEGRMAFETHVERLASAGYEVRRVPFGEDDELVEMDRRAMTLLDGEMARVHASWFNQHRARYRPRTVRGIERGQAVSDDALAGYRAYQKIFRRRVEALMDAAGLDLWITPASGGPAPEGYDVTGWGGMTTAWSFAGLPCVTVPAGRAANGLPLGLQAIARTGQDEKLLAAAHGLEGVLSAAR